MRCPFELGFSYSLGKYLVVQGWLVGQLCFELSEEPPSCFQSGCTGLRPTRGQGGLFLLVSSPVLVSCVDSHLSDRAEVVSHCGIFFFF